MGNTIMLRKRPALGVITANQNVEPAPVMEKKGLVRKITDLVQTTKGVVQNERNSGKRRREDECTVRQSKKQKIMSKMTSLKDTEVCESTVLIVPPAPCDEQAVNDPNQFPEYASMIQRFADLTDEKSKKELFGGKTLLESMLQKQGLTTIVNFRPLVINWVAEICSKLSLSDETYHRAIMIFDRNLALRKVTVHGIQRSGIASLIIAMKMEETYPCLLSDIVQITQNTISEEEMRSEEIIVLNTLKFDLGFMTPLGHLNRMCRLVGLPPKYTMLAQYLLELIIISRIPTQTDLQLSTISAAAAAGGENAAVNPQKDLLKASPILQYAPSRVAAAATHLACRIFKNDLDRLNVRVPILLETNTPPVTLNTYLPVSDAENTKQKNKSSSEQAAADAAAAVEEDSEEDANKSSSADSATKKETDEDAAVKANKKKEAEEALKGVSDLVNFRLAPFAFSKGEASNVALPLMRAPEACKDKKCKFGGKFEGNAAKPLSDAVNDEARPENWGPFLETHSGWTKSELMEVEVMIIGTLRGLKSFNKEILDVTVEDDGENYSLDEPGLSEEQKRIRMEKRTKRDIAKAQKEQVLMSKLSPELKPFHYLKKKYADPERFEWAFIEFG
eukprot:GDKK01017072.1.p1 GENE.GDKK01017072.1~~GDKK01017072.1.p1  ORF type:complete len:619 (-),score=179.11 GDKK01017072.1:420-2276(-)